jgi:hypothetical protein
MPKKILHISGKTSDLCFARLLDENNLVGHEHNGYVPDWFPNPSEKHFGDYIELKINLETGQILNWKKPTEAQLKETFKY